MDFFKNIFGTKKPTKVIMHCSATPDDNEVGSRWFDLDISEVRRWHVEERGWRDVGYHFFIKRDGTIQNGRKVGKKGAHCRGQNHQIGVCYAGSYRPTDAQKDSMKKLAQSFLLGYGISTLQWHCHHEYANKECPGFSRKELFEIIS